MAVIGLAMGIFAFPISSADPDLIPNWIKNTAGFWANDQISDSEFVTALEDLIIFIFI